MQLMHVRQTNGGATGGRRQRAPHSSINLDVYAPGSHSACAVPPAPAPTPPPRQVIDDTAGATLAATSTLNPEIRQALNGGAGANVDAAKLVGAAIAELCKQKNIEKVCFDRGGFRYHGRVQALADAAREAGLNF